MSSVRPGLAYSKTRSRRISVFFCFILIGYVHQGFPEKRAGAAIDWVGSLVLGKTGRVGVIVHSEGSEAGEMRIDVGRSAVK